MGDGEKWHMNVEPPKGDIGNPFDIPLCGRPPRNLFFEPCCLEPGHDGACRVWKQEPWDHGHDGATFGTRTYEETYNGHRLIQCFETAGELLPAEVGALVQYLEAVRRPKQPQDPTPTYEREER